MDFHWSLSDSNSPQISRTLLSTLSVFNEAVFRMVFTRLPASKYSRFFNDSLVTVPKAPITSGTIVTFMFHSFFQFSSKVEVLILVFTFFQFYSVVSRDRKIDYSLWVFHISFSWCFFTGVWVIASLLKSPGLFSVFCFFINNAVVWMISSGRPASMSPNPINNPLATVLKAPITTGIIVTFIFYSFFNSLVKSRYLSIF